MSQSLHDTAIQEVKARVVKHERPDLVNRIDYLDDIINKKLKTIIPLDASIIQLGCACGYILDTFKANGYTHLTGVDKDEALKATFPPGIEFINDTVRGVLERGTKYDVVITHKFLYILPPEKKNDELMESISKSFTKYLITFEEEGGIMGRAGDTQFPVVYYNRNYKKVFEKLGLKEEWMDVGAIQYLAFRMFTK